MSTAKLSSHPNVYRTCIRLLRIKGWEITVTPTLYEEEDGLIDLFRAQRDGTEVVADNPIELLGLASIHEYHSPHDGAPYWWVIDEKGDFLDELETEALERSFFDFRDRNLEGWKSEVLKILSNRNNKIDQHDALGISRESYSDLLKEYPEFDR